MRPIFYAIERVLMFMLRIQSGQYLPTIVWVAGGAGIGVDYNRSSQYWCMLYTPANVTMEDVMAVFFFSPYNPTKRKRYFAPDITERQIEEASGAAAERTNRTATL